MANINLPDQRQNIWLSNDIAVVSDGTVDLTWYRFYSLVREWIIQNSQAGTTAQRPTTNLYAGRYYFDTSLGANGKPIWLNKNATGWIDATGAAV